MMYKIEVYENPFDLTPLLTTQTDDVMQAEASIRNLTEKARQIINEKQNHD